MMIDKVFAASPPKVTPPTPSRTLPDTPTGLIEAGFAPVFLDSKTRKSYNMSTHEM